MVATAFTNYLTISFVFVDTSTSLVCYCCAERKEKLFFLALNKQSNTGLVTIDVGDVTGHVIDVTIRYDTFFRIIFRDCDYSVYTIPCMKSLLLLFISLTQEQNSARNM